MQVVEEAASRAIQLYQRDKLGHRNWRDTHVQHFIGEVNMGLVRECLGNGQIEGVAEDWGVSVERVLAILADYRHICFSQTSPHATLTNLSSQWDTHQISAYYPLFTGASKAYLHFLEAQCFRYIGRDYDEGQLLDIWLNEMLGYEPGTYKPLFDESSERTVCSGSEALFWNALGVWIEKQTEQLPWPRLFGGLRLERVAPSHFANSPYEWAQRPRGIIRPGDVILTHPNKLAA